VTFIFNDPMDLLHLANTLRIKITAIKIFTLRIFILCDISGPSCFNKKYNLQLLWKEYLYISDMVDSHFCVIKLQAVPNQNKADARITRPWNATARSQIVFENVFVSYVFMFYDLLSFLNCVINNNNNNNNRVKFSNIFLVLPFWDD